MKTLGESDIIDVLVKCEQYFIFSPDSILTCAKLNLKIALIGPCPRQISSDKTHLPGLLNPYQLQYLIRHYTNHLRFYDASKEQTTLDGDDLLVEIDRMVALEHDKIAAKFNQKAKPPNYKDDKSYRWQINHLQSKWPRITESINTIVDEERYKIYEHFTKNGYWLTTGLQYGCDWLAYRGTPDLYHSECIVYCSPYHDRLRVEHLMRLTRIGSKTNKRLIIASVHNDQIICTSITWSNRG